MKSDLLDEILKSNRHYAAAFGAKAELAARPRKRVAILTCMDARLDPFKFAGLTEGDAHVVRNAGGRATDDAIRSLVISHKLLGTRIWLVIHHTRCGMQSFTNEVMAELLESSLETAKLTPQGWRNSEEGTDSIGAEEGTGSIEGHFIHWMTISDPAKSLIVDVRRIRKHPLVSPTVAVYGLVFDVESGNLHEVPEASQIGRPASRR